MSAWEVYLVTRCNQICTFSRVFLAFAALGLFVLTIIYFFARIAVTQDDQNTNASARDELVEFYRWIGRVLRNWIVVVVVLAVVALAMPNTQELGSIYFIPKLRESQMSVDTREVCDMNDEWTTQIGDGKQAEKSP